MPRTTKEAADLFFNHRPAFIKLVDESLVSGDCMICGGLSRYQMASCSVCSLAFNKIVNIRLAIRDKERRLQKTLQAYAKSKGWTVHPCS